MAFDNPYSRQFADLIANFDKRLTTMTQGQRVAQFGYSSVEDDFINVYDALGQAKQRIGKQSDGQFAVTYRNGDPPPKPSVPVVSARQLAILVSVDGTFDGDKGAPSNLERFDVHMSTDGADFTPDGTTIVGDIPSTGGVCTVPADSETHYVKVMGVTLGDVPGPPTDPIAVLPLPAGEIAAGAIGAEQLAATLILASNIISGDPNSSHTSLNATGFQAYSDDLHKTFDVDADTGNVYIRGELRSADSGKRVVINPESPDGTNQGVIQFWPGEGATSSNPATIGSNVAQGVSNVTITSPKDTEGRYGYLNLGPTVRFGIQEADGTYCELNISSSNTSYATDNDSTFGWRSILMLPRWSTGIDGVGGVYGLDNNNNAIGFAFVRPTNPINLCYVYGDSGLAVVAPDASVYKPVFASSFSVQSARITKKNIVKVPGSALDAIRQAPVSKFNLKADKEERIHIGPMADDLPPWLVQSVPGLPVHQANENGDGLENIESGDPIQGIALDSMMGALWEAIRQLDEEFDAFRDQVKIKRPSRKKS